MIFFLIAAGGVLVVATLVGSVILFILAFYPDKPSEAGEEGEDRDTRRPTHFKT